MIIYVDNSGRFPEIKVTDHVNPPDTFSHLVFPTFEAAEKYCRNAEKAEEHFRETFGGLSGNLLDRSMGMRT